MRGRLHSALPVEGATQAPIIAKRGELRDRYRNNEFFAEAEQREVV